MIYLIFVVDIDIFIVSEILLKFCRSVVVQQLRERLKARQGHHRLAAMEAL
jgi:hypothetical protein